MSTATIRKIKKRSTQPRNQKKKHPKNLRVNVNIPKNTC
jgi:hypothetical protein